MESEGARPRPRPGAMRKSEALANESVACLTLALGHLRDIWEEIGIPEDQRLQRTDVVRKHVKGLLDLMVAEEERLRERLLQSIALCRKELASLCRELQLPAFQEDEGATILQLEKDLRTRVEVMLKQKRERKQELKALQERDQDLCEILCAEPFDAGDAEAVPSLAQLDAFRRHLAALAAEKERRRTEFLETKRQIVRSMEELEQSPESSFEQDVVCEDEEAFCLSLENIAALKALLQQLEIRKAQKEALCEELRSRILALWDRLKIPTEERDTFAPYLVGSGSKIMNALQLEVDRLEQLKIHNLRNVVEAIRVELASYWDKCFYSEEQRHGFSPYYQDDFTEELLQQHDDEVMRLKRYYEVHQEMFEGIHKWEENWHLFQELERKAMDPSRFTNRGGNLLKEEKLRVKLQKTLPKLEEELQGRVERWEQEHGAPFLVNGQPFLEYVAEQWRLHHLEKEKERQERQLKKSRQIEEEMMYGSSPRTPNKRRVLAFTTPGKMRKLNTTACTPNSTMRSALGGSVFSAPGSHPPLSGRKPARTPSQTASKPSRHGRLEHNKENISQLNGTALSGGCFPTAPLQRTSRINSVASTYSEFARELSKASKSELGSCILNSTASNLQG
ncbi:protein regulator of cytokinesis 1 isoform X2 [Sceloporus undulatus]|uniref:protein regulator of cytokinesis 1 isoform X2 n=1 Tax=Sceloporus undulatus TaxID=8520 RepID=UPI001C4CC74D|nr:protein regulator of cytokinesis 1 isoform X2 [Sceloporus undulatus]